MTTASPTHPAAPYDTPSDTSEDRSATDRVRETTERVRDEVSRRADDAKRSTQAAGRQIADTAQTLGEQSNQFVRDNPGVALAGALGIGVLLGMALRSNYRDY